MNEKYYTTQEVADLLGLSVLTVRNYIRDGKLKAVKIGQWRIPETALKEMLEVKPEDQ